MTPPTNLHSIRFVPENATKDTPAVIFRLSGDYAKSRWGIFTILQMLSSFVTFVVSVSSRTHNYEVTNLVIYVAPKAAIMFVVIYSFCFFYTDLLIIVASTLSNFDAQSLQQSLFYMLVTASAAIFNVSASIAIFSTYTANVLNQAIAGLALVSSVVYTVRCLWISTKLLRTQQDG